MSTPESETTKAMADIKGVIAGLPADIAKVKTFWADYRLYFVAVGCLIIGAFIGHAV